ncbi:MAG: hypothetical protein HYU78_11130 [Rhodocyclales bacterium]|nr:hypothetical protein [Rhodocyclales bacterium]
MHAILLALLAGTATVATAADVATGKTVHKRAGKTAGELIRAAAEVIAIDPASRTLTLKREDGNTLTVVADSRIRNLAQVSVGDIVVAQYGHARALSLKKVAVQHPDGENGGTPPPPARAADGQRKRTIVADIIAIDDRTGQATLKGQKGEVVDVVVNNRKLLSAVRIGDRVELGYTDAVAVAIKPAGKAIPPKRHSSP